MAALAHSMDTLLDTSAPVENPAAELRLEATAFVHALVALSAKLAVVDGLANAAEYQAFCTLVAEAEAQHELPRLRSLFMKFLSDTSGALQYARQLAAITPGDQKLHEDLLRKLVAIAAADAPLNASEMRLLQAISDIFGMGHEQLAALIAQHRATVPSPHEVLGLSATATAEEARERYRAKVQLLHPDRHQAAGASPEEVAMASSRLAALNAAYDTIKHHQESETGRTVEKTPVKLQGIASWWGFRNTKGAKA